MSKEDRINSNSTLRKVAVHKSGKTSKRPQRRPRRLHGAYGESLRSRLINEGSIIPCPSHSWQDIWAGDF